MENKNQKFIRLAESRVDKAFKALDLIGNLTNRYSYEYSESEGKQIIKALHQKVKDIEVKFSQGLTNKKFKL